MRAQSKVATFLQEPDTIFGMATSHFFLVVAISFCLFIVLSELVMGSAGFLGALGFFLFGVIFAIVLRRRDIHTETVLLLPVLFYAQKGFPFPLKTTRIFIAGQPLKPKKRRKVKP